MKRKEMNMMKEMTKLPTEMTKIPTEMTKLPTEMTKRPTEVALKNKQGTKAKNGHGGARPGGGRPKGSSNKIKIEDLIHSMEAHLDVSVTDRFALNYVGAIQRGDWTKVSEYDRALLNKVIADQQHITIDETTTVENRQHAFLRALETIGTVALQQDTVVQPAPLAYEPIKPPESDSDY
jgi:hypothetical protein